ncbi:hypothetical protein K439DRAFT_680445 [Ramaria rubella]|nr:hypothetical protein K439DRAFT_680445 [Ramaria rubella]
MINLDQHSKEQTNNNIISTDWHKNHAVMNAADPAILSVNPSLTYTPDDSPLRPRSAHPIDPVTPADAADPAPSNQNPSPDTPGDLLSAPNDDNDSNSSLSPVPSPDGNHGSSHNQVYPDPTGDERSDDPSRSSPQNAGGAVSRQSTPLTDLSGPMTPSRTKDEDPNGHERTTMEPDQQSDATNIGQGEDAEGKNDGRQGAETSKGRSSSGERGERGQARALERGTEPAGEGSAQPSNGGALSSAIPLSSNNKLQPNGIASGSTADNVPSGGLSNSQKSPPEPPDEKATTILQLNTELLKVCMECQTRHMMQSSEFNAHATRLQSNLTWLAAAADRERHKNIPLPIMSPPVAVPWSTSQTINEYYQRLPNLFAKEIAKRQKEAVQANTGGVKRGPDTATDDTNGMGMRKRIDTGERRTSQPAPTATSPPHARSPSVLSNGTVGSSSGLGMNLSMNMNIDPHSQPAQAIGMQQQQQQQQQQSPMHVSPEAMTGQQMLQQFPTGGMSEAQMVQARERARMIQMRQNQQAAMAAKEPQRMPPPSLPNGLPNPMAAVSNTPAVGGGSGGGGQGNSAQVMQAILSTFGQTGLQNYHALGQGTNHPFVNYMSTHVPGFMQLPLQQQLQRMHIVQVRVYLLISCYDG